MNKRKIASKSCCYRLHFDLKSFKAADLQPHFLTNWVDRVDNNHDFIVNILLPFPL